ncbi:MAG: hypothetical protein R3250_17870, partial [Melioribacteraceae bacterium]|nr:hypothetical protein [Melioribacteraceae bacterium]
MKSSPPYIPQAFLIIAYSVCILLFSPVLVAQDNLQIKNDLRIKFDYTDEIPDDNYFPVQKELQQRSAAFKYVSSEFVSVQVNVDSLGMNIIGDAANEPSITVDPASPDNMAIGWRQFDTISSNFRQAGYGYSTDGGQTWTTGIIEPGI